MPKKRGRDAHDDHGRDHVAAPIDKGWRAYTTPQYIKQWNAASDDWRTTASTVDLREGGAFSARMEAKDRSMGFDFEAGHSSKERTLVKRLPTYFISHGGGPWPWLPSWRSSFTNLEASLARMPAEIGDLPKAVLVLSGHWEESEFAVMSSAHPPMVYDYYGFPRETYELVYPAPGAPDLANRAADLIRAADLPARLDERRGFDHGAFVPLSVMYPKADVPVFQISLKSGYDPAEHLALGRSLAPLRDEGVLIVGSGLSYHNLQMFDPNAKEPSEAFDAWLGNALSSESENRTEELIIWEEAPYARICHPREDHLAPLFVVVGAAEQEKATRVYHDRALFGGVTASSYRFG